MYYNKVHAVNDTSVKYTVEHEQIHLFQNETKSKLETEIQIC